MILLETATVRLLHARLLSLFGGDSGVRDLGLLESAMARPTNLILYADPSLYDVAACYAYGLCQNHPFVDGNKRVAFVAAATFLELNGMMVTATEADVVTRMLAVAASEKDEPELARWFEANSCPAPETP